MKMIKISDAFNKGLKLAKNKFVYFIDLETHFIIKIVLKTLKSKL